jgi:hypothetical protein
MPLLIGGDEPLMATASGPKQLSLNFVGADIFGQLSHF